MDQRWNTLILIGIVVGLVAALVSVALFGEAMTHVEILGTIFLKALKMIIVPLIVASMVVGVTGMGDVRKLGRVGTLTLFYYGVTTGMSVLLGIILVNLSQPGHGITIAAASAPAHVVAKGATGIKEIILSFFSDNIVQSMSEMDILPIIMFSLLFGGVLTTIGEAGKPVISLFHGINEAMMKIVYLVMFLAPLGVFGLVASQFAKAGSLGSLVGGLGKYMATVLIGLAIHGFIVLPALLALFGKRNPYRFMINMGSALLTAFSTASSSATLPLTIESVQHNNGVQRRAAYFVLPIGATINMDGTALYESVAAIFIAQASGIHLSLTQQAIVFLTATLAAVGAAGIPQAGLVTMVIVLRAVGLPLEGVGLILAVDWFLDRFRTTVNVWGDACGAGIIDRYMERAGPAATEPLGE